MFLVLHGFGLRGYDKVWMKEGERGTGERLRDYACFASSLFAWLSLLWDVPIYQY